jgi:hypothetical protein
VVELRKADALHKRARVLTVGHIYELIADLHRCQHCSQQDQTRLQFNTRQISKNPKYEIVRPMDSGLAYPRVDAAAWGRCGASHVYSRAWVLITAVLCFCLCLIVSYSYQWSRPARRPVTYTARPPA